MSKKRKRPHFTFRPELVLHERLTRLAYLNAMPVNGLLVFLLKHAIGPFEVLMAGLEEVGGANAKGQFVQFKKWLAKNPEGTLEQFLKSLVKQKNDVTLPPPMSDWLRKQMEEADRASQKQTDEEAQDEVRDEY